ncbi:hypothetical protein BGZ70_000099 [Mortierella alpina]|uniref:Uncharacterized protein n=1 Tax=Mortierella alpina TaxID=64518 RepID=A0A9P6J0G1_MORAP|nr:hypothetical protein BGZ70_000099 [Mortierella alpina]
MDDYDVVVYSRKGDLHPEIRGVLERIFALHHIHYFTTVASDDECVQHTKEFARTHQVPHFFIISDGLMKNGKPYVAVYIKFSSNNWDDALRLLATKGPLGTISVAGMIHNRTEAELLDEATYWEDGILDFEGYDGTY